MSYAAQPCGPVDARDAFSAQRVGQRDAQGVKETTRNHGPCFFVLRPGSAFARGLDFALKRAYEYQLISMGLTPEGIMAHKKIERKKELDRRRHRRAQRLKQRVREAKAAAKA